MRNWISLVVAFGLSLSIAGCGEQPQSPAARKPNILFILLDDLRWDTVGYAGHPNLKTPNIDRIANEGVNFRNAFSTTSLCSPSRASLLSGLYAHRHGVTNNFTEFPSALDSFPKALQRAGYTTAYIGKYHMGENNDEPRPGFDYFVTHKGQGKYYDNEFNFNGQRRELVKGYYTTAVTDIALEWLKRDHGGKPWVLMLGHKAPHSFYTPEPRFAHTFDDVRVPYPSSAFSLQDKPEWIKERMYTWHGIYGPLFEWRKKFPDDSPGAVKDFENMVHAYWGTVLSVDESVARLRTWLEETGQLDNTIIVFLGDNGLLQGEHGMVDKRTVHEPSIRIPMAVRYPWLTKDGENDRSASAHGRHGAESAGVDRNAASPEHRRPLVGDAGEVGRSRLAQELVLLLQLRGRVSLHTKRPCGSHRGVEVHPLSARRRWTRSAHGGVVRPPPRSRGEQEPDFRSQVGRDAGAAESGADPPDGGDWPLTSQRQDAAGRRDKKGAARSANSVNLAPENLVEPYRTS